MTVNITIVDDFVVEGDESFEAILTLLNTTDPNTALGNTTLTVIIKNDDGLLPPTPGM